jgi:acyl dehydratase
MIDRKWIGQELGHSVLPIERRRLQLFAKSIGENNSVYTDVAAANAAGYSDLPAPPTFLFSAELDSGATDRLVNDLGIPLAKLLHGEQEFKYFRTICCGDTVTVRSRITDIYDKRSGSLEFVVRTSRALNQKNELVAELRTVFVFRH